MTEHSASESGDGMAPSMQRTLSEPPLPKQEEPVAFLCDGCGALTNDPKANIEKLRADGFLSCCPERKMIPLYVRRSLNGAEVRIRDRLEALADHGCSSMDEAQEIASDAILLLNTRPSLGARMREDLEYIKKRIKNCRGAIESNQVVDKDVHGNLGKIIDLIDAAQSGKMGGEG